VENKLPNAPEPERASQPPSPKQAWVTPRLAFVEPRLTKHGELTKVTGAFFGAFSPGLED
jgi:hypothetical protein